MTSDRPQPTRRRALQLTGVVIAGALAGCAEDDADDELVEDDEIVENGEAAEIVQVAPGDTTVFDPQLVEIEVGETVRWEWEHGHHTVTPAEIPGESDWEGETEEHDARHTYEHTFEVEGEYEYYCEPHQDQGMEGEVVVR